MDKSKKHMTPAEMKKKEEISSAMKRKDSKEYMQKKYGKRADEVRSRTAIKMAMKESYKDFFKRQLMESLLSEMSLSNSTDSPMISTESDVPNLLVPPSSPPTSPVQTYPTYNTPAPVRGDYPTQQTWQKDWNKWRDRYRQLVDAWNPNPGPPNPNDYPRGADDSRYQEDFRYWHRQFMNS